MTAIEKKSTTKKTSKQRAKKIASLSFANVVKYGIIISMAFVFLLPFLYMIVTSIKSPIDLANPTVKWIASGFHFENFRIAFKGLNFVNGFKNSMIISTICTFAHVLSCSLAGYGLARFKFKGRTVALTVLILTIIVPAQVIMTPTYILTAKMKLDGSILSLIVPSFLGVGLRGGLYIFIFRQFFTGVPHELEEAAKVDGCGPFATFFRIIIPISKPPVLVSAVLSFVWHWNDPYESAILLGGGKNKLLSASLPDLYDVLIKGSASAETWERALIYNEAVIMAATFLVVLPLIIFYFFAQKQFIEGAERSGIVG